MIDSQLKLLRKGTRFFFKGIAYILLSPTHSDPLHKKVARNTQTQEKISIKGSELVAHKSSEGYLRSPPVERKIKAAKRAVKAGQRSAARQKKVQGKIKRTTQHRFVPSLLKPFHPRQWAELVAHSIQQESLKKCTCIAGCIACHDIGWVGEITNGIGHYYTTAEFAFMGGVSRMTVCRMCDRGELRFFKLPGSKHRYIA